MSHGVLIVGASHAGVALASALRSGGYRHPVRLANAEPFLPYRRPPLSKAYLSGEFRETSLDIRAARFYSERQIELLDGERIVDVDLDGHRAWTSSGGSRQFDHLALAVGARVHRLTVPGAELEGTAYLRDRADADRLRALLPAARSVVVVGGGFVGLEAASMARKDGKVVTVVEASDRLLNRSASPLMSEYFLRLHERHGTTVRTGTQVIALDGAAGQLREVHLADGQVLQADVVIVGIGVVPRLELASRMGLKVAGGIVVDKQARTSHPAVVAAGDCTVMPHPIEPGAMVRLESVQNAQDQATAAAATIGGQDPADSPPPRFWSDQYGVKVQTVGLVHGHDHLEVDGDPDADRFAVRYFRRGELIALDAVNQPAEFARARRLLTAGRVPGVQIEPASPR